MTKFFSKNIFRFPTCLSIVRSIPGLYAWLANRFYFGGNSFINQKVILVCAIFLALTQGLAGDFPITITLIEQPFDQHLNEQIIKTPVLVKSYLPPVVACRYNYLF